jgi:hypothetical protein
MNKWEADSDPNDDMDDFFRWMIGKCTECSIPYIFQDSYFWLGDELQTDTVQIFLERDRSLPHFVPNEIRSAFDEANRCFRAQSFTAVSILSRKAVAAFCHELQAKGTNLSSQLMYLKENGVLDSKLFEWASLVRIVGNDGAHGVNNPITRVDAEGLLEFVEALMDYHYVFQKKFQDFKERRTGFGERNQVS